MHVLLLAILACGAPMGGAPAAEPAPSRTIAVASDGHDTDPAAFCEVWAPEAATARSFVLPETEGPVPAPDPGWTWWNLWATWCVPCLEELPRIREWDARLDQEGVPVAVRFLSVDAAQADLDAWRGRRPDAPTGPRVRDQATVGPWLASLGVDASASIPIHVLVDPAGKVRCVRVGGVGDTDYATVRRILQGR